MAAAAAAAARNGTSSTTNGAVNGEHKQQTKDVVGGVPGFAWVTKNVNWDATHLSFPDPTRVFSLLVVGIMLIRYMEAEQWDVQKAIFGFFFNPYVIFAFVSCTSVVYFGYNNSRKLSVADKWAIEWYWWNAWLYHLVMDGFSGSFQKVPVVVQQYFTLDKRFQTHHVVPWMIGCIEIICMAPCCLITIWFILKQYPLRYPMELITSTFQFMGMIVFVFAEVYEGQLNVPALDPVGVPGNRWANIKVFDLYHFVYYWFGFWFCNLVWGVVPYYRIMASLQQCYIRMKKNDSSGKTD